MIWRNQVTNHLKLDYPIIQAPMLGVSSPEMVAAVSNSGGLGSLPVGGLSPDSTRKLIRRTKGLTDKPFAVNLFAHEIPAYSREEIKPMQQLLLKMAARKGYFPDTAGLPDFNFYTYSDQTEVLVQEEIQIISFTFGCFDDQTIQLLKSKECTLIGTATSLEEALFLQQHHIDMVVVQGIEAGGHRGTFIHNIPLPQVGLFSLLPQVKSAVKIPCIAAGGINSGRTIKAAFELGADAVQIGTAFIGTAESDAIDSYKARLKETTDTSTTLTRAFSGRWARGIKNEMMQEIEQAGILIPPYPVQNILTAKIRTLAQLNNDCEFTSMWAGQSGITMEKNHAKDVFLELVRECDALYGD